MKAVSVISEGSFRAIIIALAVVIVFVALISLVTQSPKTVNHKAITIGHWAQQYNQTAGVGTFIQTADKGFAIVGTSVNQSLMLIRTNETLSEQWRKTYGTGFGNAIAPAASDGFILAGAKTLSTELGSQNTSWLIKTDSEGNMLWTKEYAGNGFTRIINASDDGYIMLGRFNATGTERPGLLKVDASGNVQWIKTYTSSEAESLALYTLVPTNDAGCAMVGEMRYTINGVNMQNGWFVKTDSNGDVQINRPFAMMAGRYFTLLCRQTMGTTCL